MNMATTTEFKYELRHRIMDMERILNLLDKDETEEAKQELRDLIQLCKESLEE